MTADEKAKVLREALEKISLDKKENPTDYITHASWMVEKADEALAATMEMEEPRKCPRCGKGDEYIHHAHNEWACHDPKSFDEKHVCVYQSALNASVEERDYTPEEAWAEAKRRWGSGACVSFTSDTLRKPYRVARAFVPFGYDTHSMDFGLSYEFDGDSFRAAFAAADAQKC